jgi:hypothetical protein
MEKRNKVGIMVYYKKPHYGDSGVDIVHDIAAFCVEEKSRMLNIRKRDGDEICISLNEIYRYDKFLHS